VLVPEAAVHEQRDPTAGKDQIRRSWQVMSMKPEPQAHRVSRATHSKLRLGVDLSDAPHMRASLGAREMIAQAASSLPYCAGSDTVTSAAAKGDRDAG
jgi:hypothetical protein